MAASWAEGIAGASSSSPSVRMDFTRWCRITLALQVFLQTVPARPPRRCIHVIMSVRKEMWPPFELQPGGKNLVDGLYERNQDPGDQSVPQEAPAGEGPAAERRLAPGGHAR